MIRFPADANLITVDPVDAHLHVHAAALDLLRRIPPGQREDARDQLYRLGCALITGDTRDPWLSVVCQAIDQAADTLADLERSST